MKSVVGLAGATRAVAVESIAAIAITKSDSVGCFLWSGGRGGERGGLFLPR